MKTLLSLLLTIHFVFGIEEISLQTKDYEQFQFAGYYMAKKNGYYKKENLKLTILPHQAGIDSTYEVIHGSATYGMGDSSLVKDIVEGKNIILLKAILQESPIIILSLNNNTFGNSKHKKIMVSKEVSKDIVFQSILANHNIQLGYDLKPIYQSPNIKDLLQNKADFIMGCSLNDPYLLKKYHLNNVHIINSNQVGLQFYSNILFTSKKELCNHPNRVKKFIRASEKGWNWVFKHIKKSAEYIYRHHNEQNKSLEALIFEGKELKRLAIKKDIAFGNISSKTLKNIEYSYKYRGILQNLKFTDNYNNYIYQPWYIKLKFQIEAYKYNIFLFMLFFIPLFVIIMMYWNFLLKKKVSQEVNRRKRQEELLKKRNALLIETDKKNKMETYIAHASHQLKSPLSSILSIVNNLKREINASNDNHLLWEEKLLKIEKKSLHMSETVNFFLKYLSKEHKKNYFSINQTIKETLIYIDTFIQQDNIQIKIEEKEDFVYLGYQIQLIQVFQTIFENAIQSLTNKKDNRCITIKIDEDSENNIVILISDNGKGIPKRHLKKIFDPYFSTKKHSNVKGLGLHIAKIIIEENFNGTIVAYNKNGAIFKIVLTPIKLTSL
jgi:signal transduction histidine kinase